MTSDTTPSSLLNDECAALRQRVAELETQVAELEASIATDHSVATALQHQRLHVEQTPLAVIEWDNNFCVTAWNPAAERIFGYSCAEAIGSYASFILPPELAPAILNHLWQDLLAQRGGTHSTNYNRTKDGRAIMCEWYNTPLVDADGSVIGVVSLAQDVTAQQQAEQERLTLQQQIIDAQQATLRELSTPLIPIADGVVAMPLIGAIDSMRAGQVMEALLEGITSQQAEFAILDITGVKVVDTQVASALLRVAQAAKLLGATVILTGISAEVAQALVTLGADLGSIITRGNLQSGIAYVLDRKP